MWDKPAIVATIFALLRERDAPVAEYDLIQHLSHAGYFAAFESDAFNLRLFKKHFITRHCLFTLQLDLAPNWSLRLDALEIHLQQIESTVVAAGQGVDVADVELRNFYLDLAQLEQADENSVGQLLKQFWERFYAWQSATEAYQVLEVQPGAAWEDILQAYRRAIQRAHPDMGGTTEEFARVRHAYETLKKI